MIAHVRTYLLAAILIMPSIASAVNCIGRAEGPTLTENIDDSLGRCVLMLLFPPLVRSKDSMRPGRRLRASG